MKRKCSLLRDCLSKESWVGRENHDEKSVFERKKIIYGGIIAIILLIIATVIFLNVLENIINRDLIIRIFSVLVGLIFYIMFIAFCKKRLVKNIGAIISMILGIPIFSGNISILFLNAFNNVKLSETASGIILFSALASVYVNIVILYIIGEKIYKKAQKDNEDVEPKE